MDKMDEARLTAVNAKEPADALLDSFGRRMRYLRISITDRCNLRCTYCRPGVKEFKGHDDLLTFEEIAKVTRIMVRLGMSKVRLTGGEPLVRKNAVTLVKMLSDIPGIEDMAMTTNAILLEKHAAALAAAGLSRVNVSLDTLRPERFKKLTSGGDIGDVLRGIEAASKAGLTPIKLNTVMMRGFNDDEFADIIDFAAAGGHTARFIECMPMREGLSWDDYYISTEDVLKKPEIRERVDVDYSESDAPMVEGRGHSASRYLPLRSGGGEVGFITPMSTRFCDQCDRLRITADGRIRSCLPNDKDIDFKEAFRRGAADAEIEALIRRAVMLKPESGEYSFDQGEKKRSMVDIGG